MPSPSVTYNFTNGTTADGDQVDTNFNDIILALTDGTKDLSILGLALAGTLTSSLLPTTATYSLGGASNAFRALFLDNGATDGGAINFNSSTSTNLKASTDGETLTGTGITSIVGSMKNFIQAWINFDGTGTPAITDSFNVTSITDGGTGIYKINLTTAFADTNFFHGGNTSAGGAVQITTTNKTTTSFQCTTRDSSGVAADTTYNCFFAIGAR